MAIAANKRNNILLAVVSFALSLLIAGVAAEFYLERQYDNWRANFGSAGEWYGGLTRISHNPVMMWEYRPSARAKGLFRNLRTNRYGFRDYDYDTVRKPPGVYRYSFVGDSVTLGLKVAEDKSFVRKFDEYMSAANPDIELQALNHGIDGYNTVQAAELMRARALQFQPDTVVYLLCLNDFDFEESGGTKLLYFNKPDSFVLTWLINLYRRSFNIDFHDWHFDKNRDAVFETIVGMQDELEARGIGFFVAVLPTFDFPGADQGFDAYPLTDMHTEIVQFLETSGIDHTDLLEPFAAQKQPAHSFARDIYHPNAAGHDLIARELRAELAPDAARHAD